MKCLEHLRGKTVEVELIHKIFGSQIARIEDFQPYEDKDTVGFYYKSNHIYLFYNELEIVSIENDRCILACKVQTIKIKRC